MRQRPEEIVFLELLNAIRSMTPGSDLEPRFQEILASRIIEGSTIEEQMLFVGNEILTDSNRMAVSYTHARCAIFNNFFVQNCLTETEPVTLYSNIFVLTKPTYFPGSNNESSSIPRQQQRLIPLLANESERRFFANAINNRHAKCTVPLTLSLRINDRVMLMKNIDPDRGLINGARGIISDFIRSEDNNHRIVGIEVNFFTITADVQRYIITPSKVCVWESPRNSVFEVFQFPLRICYISTSHKTQGLTLDDIYVDIGEDAFPFAHGSFYVVQSRVRRLENLHFCGRLEWPEEGIKFYVNPFISQNEAFLREREAHRPNMNDFHELVNEE
jgi:hypothetical protein